MMLVNWTEPALEDLANIKAYIAKDSQFMLAGLLSGCLRQRNSWRVFPN
jgi:hypothetical protein